MAVLFVQVAEATVQAAGIKKLYANTYSFLTILPSNNGIYTHVVYSTSDDQSSYHWHSKKCLPGYHNAG